MPIFVACLIKTPTGRIPGTIMRFKIDKNLLRVGQEFTDYPNINPLEFSRGLCAALIKAGMIEDTNEHWGEPVISATGQCYIKDVCAVFAGYLYEDESHSIHSDIFDAFCKLVIIGDGGCPDCGGELEYVETEGHELKDGDYLTPNSYVVDNYIYRCRECGKIIKSEKEL